MNKVLAFAVAVTFGCGNSSPLDDAGSPGADATFVDGGFGDASFDASMFPLAGFGDISGDCDTLTVADFTGVAPRLLRNTIDFSVPFTPADVPALSVGGQKNLERR